MDEIVKQIVELVRDGGQAAVWMFVVYYAFKLVWLGVLMGGLGFIVRTVMSTGSLLSERYHHMTHFPEIDAARLEPDQQVKLEDWDKRRKYLLI